LTHAELHRALRAALRLGLVQRNVTELVDAPRMVRHDMDTFSPEEARRLLATARGDRFEALYVLALSTGMRQGELLALRWRDADLAAGTLRVTSTLQNIRGTLVIADPKTASSRRQIALSPTAVEVLRRHRVLQADERTRLGAGWHELDLVFPNTIGKPMDGIHLLQRNYLPLLEQAGLKRIRFHDLRHTAATLLLLSGIHPKVVSEMLGHADVTITLKLYSHVLPHMQHAAAAAMEQLLRDPTAGAEDNGK
jgi:integrase